MQISDTLIALFLAILTISISYKIFRRLQLSAAKHPSLRGHSKWSRRIARHIPSFEYDSEKFYSSDNAPPDLVQKRKNAIKSLLDRYKSHFKLTINYQKELEPTVSDVQFTNQYRIPFPFRAGLPKELFVGSIVEQTLGPKLIDLDGNQRYDVSGSYGVNVLGYEFYKKCMKESAEKVDNLGPVLGGYHSVIKENVEMIRKISGQDEVSFHMSGTEAVMQAVRLARYHTGRSHLVRFCGAYHGWWDGVQPGVGNNRVVNDVYTLEDLSERTLTVLKTRNDIACVLINPMQAFHPNSDSPSDSTLIASDRTVTPRKEEYLSWLKRIREVCSSRGIVLIFDEVFTGFRLDIRGAQGYYGIDADLVTYGKTLGGGYPIGAVAGKSRLMKRFKENKPGDVSLARGTFNSHPYVLASMNYFLKSLFTDQVQALYRSQESLWNQRTDYFNKRLLESELPIKIVNFHSVLTTIYTVPSRYNWLFQFYLKLEGLELSWIGTGRMIMSFDMTDEQFIEIVEIYLCAARKMQKDGWWEDLGLNNRQIKKQFLRELVVARFPLLGSFFSDSILYSNSKNLTNSSADQSANCKGEI